MAASLVPPAISYFAVERHMGFALPMLIGTWLGSASVIIAVLMSPETKGKVFVPELMKAERWRCDKRIGLTPRRTSP